MRFRRSIRVTIEHGHANQRSDDVSSTAYWYQAEPHGAAAAAAAGRAADALTGRRSTRTEPRGEKRGEVERETGFEPATFSLGS